jgi:hypothetical protein
MRSNKIGSGSGPSVSRSAVRPGIGLMPKSPGVSSKTIPNVGLFNSARGRLPFAANLVKGLSGYEGSVPSGLAALARQMGAPGKAASAA